MEGSEMILWVDDDIYGSVRPFIEELELSGKRVIKAQNPEEMWDKLKEYYKDIKIIVMDVLLPVGKDIDPDEAQMGLITGLLLLDKILKKSAYSDIPLIIFTILNDQVVHEWAKQHHVKYVLKQETLPSEFLVLVEENKK